MRDYPLVKQERTNWRCQAISARHREWGYNCPAVDLDFVVAEYNYGKPVALVEYKDIRHNPANTSSQTYSALKALADGYSGGPLPFLIAVYDPDGWWFKVHPVNESARDHYRHCAEQAITEQRFVRSLYLLRKRVLDANDEAAIARLNTSLPPEVAA
jgi:hypothetical protein